MRGRLRARNRENGDRGSEGQAKRQPRYARDGKGEQHISWRRRRPPRVPPSRQSYRPRRPGACTASRGLGQLSAGERETKRKGATHRRTLLDIVCLTRHRRQRERHAGVQVEAERGGRVRATSDGLEDDLDVSRGDEADGTPRNSPCLPWATFSRQRTWRAWRHCAHMAESAWTFPDAGTTRKRT